MCLIKKPNQFLKNMKLFQISNLHIIRLWREKTKKTLSHTFLPLACLLHPVSSRRLKYLRVLLLMSNSPVLLSPIQHALERLCQPLWCFTVTHLPRRWFCRALTSSTHFTLSRRWRNIFCLSVYLSYLYYLLRISKWLLVNTIKLFFTF